MVEQAQLVKRGFGIRVSGVDKKLQTRVIVVECLPEGQEMLLACGDLKSFGLLHQDFPKPCLSSGDTLHITCSSRKHCQAGGGPGLRRMEDAFMAASAVPLYMAYRLLQWKTKKMNQARQRAPRGEGRPVWANPGRVDAEEGEVQGRVFRRPPVAFRPPQSVAMIPRPVHEEICEECREEAAGYDVLRGHFQPLPPLV